MNLYNNYTVTRIVANQVMQMNLAVISEYLLKLVVNQKELVSLICSPKDLADLAAGYLYSEGHYQSKQQIHIQLEKETAYIQMDEDPRHGPQRISSSGAKTIGEPNHLGSKLTDLVLLPKSIFQYVRELTNQSHIYKKTRGVHNALLVDTNSAYMVFREDIGRHNTVDKIIGHIVLNNVSPQNKILVISGRVSTEILSKVSRIGLPMIVSMAAPTESAIQLADQLGITIIGLVREHEMNIYTHPQRIKFSS